MTMGYKNQNKNKDIEQSIAAIANEINENCI